MAGREGKGAAVASGAASPACTARSCRRVVCGLASGMLVEGEWGVKGFGS